MLNLLITAGVLAAWVGLTGLAVRVWNRLDE